MQKTIETKKENWIEYDDNKQEKTLKEAIEKMHVFKQIDDKQFDCKNDNFKTFLHILCPKDTTKIDNAIETNNKDALKTIIKYSIFNELKGLLLPKQDTITSYDIAVLIENQKDNKYNKFYKFLFSYGKPISVEKSCSTNDAILHHVDEQQDFIYIYPFSLNKKGNKLNVCCVSDNKQYDLTQEEEECFEFTKTLSMSEIKVYLEVLKKILTEKRIQKTIDDVNKEEIITINDVNKEEIINAMKDAQKAVEEDRNEQKDKKEDLNHNKSTNVDNDSKDIIEKKPKLDKNSHINCNYVKNKEEQKKKVSFSNIYVIDVESYKKYNKMGDLSEEAQPEENSNHDEDNHDEDNHDEDNHDEGNHKEGDHKEDNHDEGNHKEGMEDLKKRIDQGSKNELAKTKNNKINEKKEVIGQNNPEIIKLNTNKNNYTQSNTNKTTSNNGDFMQSLRNTWPCSLCFGNND